MSFSLCVVVKLTQIKHISGKWAVKKRVQKSPNLCNVQKFSAVVIGNELGLTIWAMWALIWVVAPVPLSPIQGPTRAEKVGGSFSIQKFMLQILEGLNRAFWAWTRKKLVQKKKSCLSHISGRGLIRPAACHVWSEPSDFFYFHLIFVTSGPVVVVGEPLLLVLGETSDAELRTSPGRTRAIPGPSSAGQFVRLQILGQEP